MIVLASIAGVLCSCTAASPHGAPGVTTTTGLPSVTAVAQGRFVTTVDLDGGDFAIQPPGNARAVLSRQTADAMFRAADVVRGDYRFSVFGLGVLTISPRVSSASGVPAATASTTTLAAGTTSPTTTAAGAANPAADATTTSVPGSAPTTNPGAATGAVPGYDGRLAWVGIAWGPDCASSNPRLGATPFVAVAFDARSGRSAVAYTSGGAKGCGATSSTPHVSQPDELVSVPWTLVGPASTAVAITVPACGAFYGWTEVPGPGNAALQVVARRPYDPDCSPATETTQPVDNVVPLGSAQSQVPHAPLGPIDALRSLPAG